MAIPVLIKKFNLSINLMLNLGAVLYGFIFLFYGPADFLSFSNSIFLVTLLKFLNGIASSLIFPLSMP
jgi:hypothetical protein